MLDRKQYLKKYYLLNKEKNKESSYLWRDKNKEKFNECGKRWRENNKEYLKEQNKLYRLANIERLRKYDRDRYLKKYNIKSEASRKRPEFCEICGSKNKICFDHDHNTGNFRGWICYKCNLALGLINDDVKILLEMVKYLKQIPQ